MSDLDALYEDWCRACELVRSAAVALDGKHMKVELATWTRCALKYVEVVPIEEDEDGDELPSKRHRELIWKQMCHISWIGAELCNATHVASRLEAARLCVIEIAAALCKHDIGNTYATLAWEDLCQFQNEYCFPKPFEGDEYATMTMLLSRCGSYNGGDIHWYQIQDFMETNVDYLHRMMGRFLILVAGLGQFACQASSRYYYYLALDATMLTSQDYNESLTTLKILKSLTRTEKTRPGVVSMHLLAPLKNPNARQMVMSMLSTYRQQRALCPRPSVTVIEDRVYLAGLNHVYAARKVLYKFLWRKWFKLRTVALYWQEQTQKRMCAPGGPGRIADLAAIAGMGVACS